MNRKEFIKTCGGSCLTLIGLTQLEACKPTLHVQGTLISSRLVIEKRAFSILKKDKIIYRKSILTKPENFDFPLAIYRFTDTEYSALLLRCSHQNNELTMSGDILSCPAHGSEFDNRGLVLQGPAEQRLQAFKVTHDEKNIYISLS